MSYGGASTSTQHLHQSLRWFFGIAAVVTDLGHVLLVDLCLDDLSCSQSELEASGKEPAWGSVIYHPLQTASQPFGRGEMISFPCSAQRMPYTQALEKIGYVLIYGAFPLVLLATPRCCADLHFHYQFNPAEPCSKWTTSGVGPKQAQPTSKRAAVMSSR